MSKDEEQRELSCAESAGNVNSCNHFASSLALPNQVEYKRTLFPAIPFLDLNVRETLTHVYQEIGNKVVYSREIEGRDYKQLKCSFI